jgi:hypothetical protein
MNLARYQNYCHPIAQIHRLVADMFVKTLLMSKKGSKKQKV